MIKTHLKNHIGYWINRLRMQVHQSFEERLNTYGITVAQWCILIALHDQQATSVKELSRYIEVDKASISRVVERLVLMELIQHMVGKDRRSGYLRLTEKGMQLVPKLLQEAEANERHFFGHLTPTETESLQSLFNKILITVPSIKRDGWMQSQGFTMSQHVHDTIAHILKEAKDNRWPYPRTFEALKKAGVESYRVSWANGHYYGLYKGSFGEFKETAPEGFKSVPIATMACPEDTQNAIVRHQQKKTSFVELLAEIAKAGISHYDVDIQQRTVRYYDLNNALIREEHVPQL
jgi:DNA-binding MarR family transcriptional regulator